jgi:hypothetical protein
VVDGVDIVELEEKNEEAKWRGRDCYYTAARRKGRTESLVISEGASLLSVICFAVANQVPKSGEIRSAFDERKEHQKVRLRR